MESHSLTLDEVKGREWRKTLSEMMDSLLKLAGYIWKIEGY
ncbi:hypothetical protein [Klebsiella pneumoniae]|nr:hypothetical protein [Klebsiella pneumoniae]